MNRTTPVKILVLDDDADFVGTIVDSLAAAGFASEGFYSVESFARAARSGRLGDVRVMLFDMNLGPRKGGGVLKAQDAILIAKTYVPDAHILVFSYQGISLDDCVQCVGLGALGLVPRPSGREEVLRVAETYANVGDPERAREAVILELWRELQASPVSRKGQLFEMLVANLLSSVDGLSLIANNWTNDAGEVDLIFRNDISDQFWRELNSLFIVVECKNRIAPSETQDFHAFKAKISARRSCNVGIMVSWAEVSTGYKSLRRQLRSEEEAIFLLNNKDLGELIACPVKDRQQYLTRHFSQQS